MHRSLRILVLLVGLLAVFGFTQSTMTGACINNNSGVTSGHDFPCDQ